MPGFTSCVMTAQEDLQRSLCSSSSRWSLKGEGNANVVLAYTGTDPILVGKVLRLRKAKAAKSADPEQQIHDATPITTGHEYAAHLQQQQHSQSQHVEATLCQNMLQQQQQQQLSLASDAAAEAASTAPTQAAAAAAAADRAVPDAVTALEAEVWKPVIPDWKRLDAMQRELAFVQCILQPRLAGCCRLAVAEAAAVEVPAELLQQQQQQQSAAGRLEPGVMGLLLPDVTRLEEGLVPPGFTTAGPCVCFEIKPKAGFIPGLEAAAVAADSIKRQHPRFVLHQLLKHLQGRSPAMSRYNPLDLFRNNKPQHQHQQQQQQQPGDPGSTEHEELLLQQAALAALLECPYNNLKVFIDGQLVYGGKADIPLVTRSQGQQQTQHVCSSGQQQQQQQQQHVSNMCQQKQQQQLLFSSGQQQQHHHHHQQLVYGGQQQQQQLLFSGQQQQQQQLVYSGQQQDQQSLLRRSVQHNQLPSTCQPRKADIKPASSDCLPLSPAAGAAATAASAAAAAAAGAAVSDSVASECRILPALKLHCSPAATTPHAAMTTPGAAAAAAAANGQLLHDLSSLVNSPTWNTRRCNISELMSQLENFPHQQQQQQQQQQQHVDGLQDSSSDTSAANAAGSVTPPILPKELFLCRVLAAVLNASGVLSALLDLQRLDTSDIEGIEPIYQQQVVLQQQQVVLQQQQQHGSSDALLSHSAEKNLAALRDYLTAATAKDCAIMVTLQQVVATSQQQQQESNPTAQQTETGPSSSTNSSRKSSGLYTDSSSGCQFVWQISLVDLDVKPLAKVPQHAALDRCIVATAQQHWGLLQQHLESRDRWLRVWLAGSQDFQLFSSTSR